MRMPYVSGGPGVVEPHVRVSATFTAVPPRGSQGASSASARIPVAAEPPPTKGNQRSFRRCTRLAMRRAQAIMVESEVSLPPSGGNRAAAPSSRGLIGRG